MKTALLTLTILLTVSFSAQAGQMWNVLELEVEAGEAGEVLAAMDKFRKTDTGKTGQSTIHLHQSLVNGANPATHSIVALYPSRAEYEKITTAASQTDDFPKLVKTIRKVATPIANRSNGTIKGWGTVSNDDRVWTTIYISAKNPMLFLQSMDKMMTSESSQAFPGQIWLSRTAYGNAGYSGTNNLIVSIGYESQTEMEKWNEALYATPAWAEFLKTNEDNSTVVNSELSVIVKTYDNNLSLEDFKK